MAKKKELKTSELDLLRHYVGKMDQFAELLRQSDEQIDELEREQAVRKQAYDDIRDAVREAKDVQSSTVKLLLHFVKPGTIDIMPLFDQMEPTDEETQGAGAGEWRKEPIAVLALSAAAMRALIDADIVLVGQLQDLVLADPDEWYAELGAVTAGMAEAIAAKLHTYIEGRSQ